jgi:hypothetical protein
VDSALPLWMNSAAITTNENSWRNSDCKFSEEREAEPLHTSYDA